MSDDRRLRERFDALRRSEAPRTPSFEATLGSARDRRAAPPPSRLWGAGFAVAATATLVVGAFLLGGPERPGSEEPFERNVYSVGPVGSWRTPTDALLETPGSDLLGGPGWSLPEVFTDPGLGPQSRIHERSHG